MASTPERLSDRTPITDPQAAHQAPQPVSTGDSEFARIDGEAKREMRRTRRTVWLSLLLGIGVGVVLILWAILGPSLGARTQLIFGILIGVEATAMGFLLAVYVHITQVRVMERYQWQLRRLALRLQEMSERDSPTGLYNHGYLLSRLEEEISLARRHQRSLSVVILDLDNFKEVNDRHGHLVGDEVLQRVAVTIRKHVRQHDIVARYGGDEFCIILPETGQAGAEAAVETLRNAFGELSLQLSKWTDGITFGSGICTYPEDGATVHALIAVADALLYREKQEQRLRRARADERRIVAGLDVPRPGSKRSA